MFWLRNKKINLRYAPFGIAALYVNIRFLIFVLSIIINKQTTELKTFLAKFGEYFSGQLYFY